jgi:hypothetical protein
MLDGPMGICVDDQGHVFVVEKGAGRLTIFSRDGKFVTSIGGKVRGGVCGTFEWLARLRGTYDTFKWCLAVTCHV